MALPISTKCFPSFEITRFDTIDSFDHVNYKLAEILRSKSLIIACLYPNSNVLEIPYSQILEIIPSICSSKDIEKLKKDSNTYLIFDFSREGFSHKVFNFFYYITETAKALDIPGEKIIFLTGNLLDEEVYKEWSNEHSPNYKIKVISVNLWDSMLYGLFRWKKHGRPHTLDQTKNEIHKGQFNFVNLNRRNRPYRNVTAYKLWHSSAKEHVMLSSDKIGPEELVGIEKWCTENNVDFDKDLWNKFSNDTPFVTDRHDFETNWVDTLPQDLFDRSLISLVGETLHEDHLDTSLFYSEKTFKPMWYNHPVFIFGQKGANTYLDKIGYATYDVYFDLSFDNINCHGERLTKAVQEIERVHKILIELTPAQKFDWLMTGEKVLEHNKNAILQQDYNNRKLRQLIKYIETGD